MNIKNKQFAKFIVVGSIGFVVDSFILYLNITIWKLDLITSRVISFSIAVIVTWFLNKTYTFATCNRCYNLSCLFFEFLRYFITSSFSILINMGLYILFVKYIYIMSKIPILAVALGSVGAMFFTYFFAKKYVFYKNKDLNDAKSI